MEGQEPLKFSLVLESKHRTALRRERLAHKKGKSRKLNKQDEAEIEEELTVCRFNPERIRRQALEEAYAVIQQEDLKQQQAEREKVLTYVNTLKSEARIEDKAERDTEILCNSVVDLATE